MYMYSLKIKLIKTHTRKKGQVSVAEADMRHSVETLGSMWLKSESGEGGREGGRDSLIGYSDPERLKTFLDA